MLRDSVEGLIAAVFESVRIRSWKVFRKHLPQCLLTVVVQVTQTENNSGFIVEDEKSSQKRSFRPMIKRINDVALVVIGEKDVVEMHDDPGLQSWQDLENNMVYVATWLYRVRRVDK